MICEEALGKASAPIEPYNTAPRLKKSPRSWSPQEGGRESWGSLLVGMGLAITTPGCGCPGAGIKGQHSQITRLQ